MTRKPNRPSLKRVATRAPTTIARLEERLRVLSGALRAFAEATTDYERLLDVVARTVADAVADGCIVRLLTPDSWLAPSAFYLPIEASIGDPEEAARLRAFLQRAQRVTDYAWGQRLVETGEPFLASPVERAALTAEIASVYAAIGIHSLLVMPLRVRGETLGTLAMFRFRSGSPPFDARDLELARALSDHAALAIANARLHRDVVHELAERERAERALRESETRFRRLVESGIVGVIIADVSGSIADANDAFLRMVGYTRDDLREGKLSARTLNPPDWTIARQAAMDRAVEEGIVLPWQREFLRKDGTRVPVLTALAMLEGTTCISVVVDLTDQRRAEAEVQLLQAQREADAKFRSLLEAAPDAMVVVGRDGTIAFVNARTESLFGYPREELIGHSVDGLVPDAVRAAHAKHRAVFFGESKVRRMGEGLALLARRKDGSEFPVEISLSPLETKDGMLVTAAIRDISERMRVERALRSALNEAEAARQELEAFCYSVAHDLRTPLRAMNGFSGILIEDHGSALDAEARGYLDRIQRNATQMGELIDALLGLSRVSRSDVERMSMNLGEMAQGLMHQLQTATPSRCVEMVVAEGLRVDADPLLLRVLLVNLLGNAWKFTGKRQTARIEIGRTPEGAFFVRDNGAGFDMRHATKLFAPFQRLHTTSEFAGTGIGLATVQRVVRRHGGEVWAEGEVEKGATFFFTLGKAE